MRINRNKIIVLVVLLALGAGLSLLLIACSAELRIFGPPTSSTPYSVPSITDLTPSFAISGSNSGMVFIDGTGFQKSFSVTYNGSPHASTFISPQQISISLSQSDLATPGNYPVVVTNPSTGGGTSSASFQVWQTLSDTTTGMSFSMPVFGDSTSLDVDSSISGQTGISPRIQSARSTTIARGFTFTVFSNSQQLDLADWFESNVDANGQLLASGAYTQTTLSDGSVALVLSGSIPDSYYENAATYHALYDAYRIASGSHIVGIEMAQDPDLAEQGYLTPGMSLSQLEIQVLGTVHF